MSNLPQLCLMWQVPHSLDKRRKRHFSTFAIDMNDEQLPSNRIESRISNV